MKSVVVACPSKLNLALDIIGTDKRGYHLMKMLMQAIDLSDRITICLTKHDDISLSCNRSSVPCDERNIAYRCAEAFLKVANISNRGIHIRIEKHIPMQAGMAGGSTDGAGVLVGLNALFQTGYSIDKLCEIGVSCGADIPFCLYGGTAKVEGIGEVITPVAPLKNCVFVVAKPQAGISTKEAFTAFDSLGISPVLDLDAMVNALKQEDLTRFSAHIYNALERVCPLDEVTALEKAMLHCGAINAKMTGSGSAVFGLFTEEALAKQCFHTLQSTVHEVYLCKPVSHGCTILKTTE